MIVYGKQVFFSILEYHKDLIDELYLAKECDKESFKKIANSGFKVQKLDSKTAQALSKGKNHQGFLLKIKEFEFSSLDELKKKEFLVLLCGISDVGNIGSIARTAYSLGVDGLVFIGQRLAMEGVIRASSGGALGLSIVLSPNVFDVFNELKQAGFKLFATDSSGNDIHNLNFVKGKKVLVLGSEGFGLPKKIVRKCDECIGIKMKNNFDSLNVSVAFAILCDRMINAKL
ncbi:23S rRNA (guanosine(2251)-2'-O)-methyltransferase RlmB [Campylobacter sp. MIT 21-1685]|uniref:23S rRNA (guanosine(2251)-2'-O)-methyltransferase RlmB n=1 Tax=unclassified Campylobacter TaxID=2593542 RepID=UPI00224B4518|nr:MULTISPECIES: 23S rRNA (guanosine(2251)-2'-O)-methyltransferase RlmB [unclassified Campylobacter]MCX2682720.1 23S rRNA (guanosine(2251)-2'-O)-methyltransferase RlmB [Campylobacter sp. MIT 21-1684]MCX2751002.1 23S rRNA (guanosine(2251)-2'-O)-methyltransferase RlmB [Campylobacter sp. MIT 21-1682]MCX2807067.1 23S rRNA (guanosine(2251)-2'-O)-methyltransferase RlmB [Campylobacter sp. MIT 21-1685]